MATGRPRLLAVDDDRAILSLVSSLAGAEGFDVRRAASASDAVRALHEEPAHLVLLDVRMPGTSGVEALLNIRAASPASRVAFMTGYGTIDQAVAAVKAGAVDYLTKPFELSRLRDLLRQVRAAADAMPMPTDGGPTASIEQTFCGMVGQSGAMREVFSLVARVAPHARTTLITGATGTGKELAARALHTLGPRAQRRFVTVNCSAVVETLFESELFGHVRGAFTGATDNKAGLFEAADGGTLFLDEVGELPLSAQAKLLRVLEDGEVQRVGALEPRRVDVRVIAATNRDLGAEVHAGRFRQDLYYRLNVVELRMPSLSQRPDDIPLLADAFVRAFARRLGKPLVRVAEDARVLLAGRAWDGNVRQLRNVIERACILADGHEVTPDVLVGHLPLTEDQCAAEPVGVQSVGPALLADVERAHILRTLQQVQGNKAVAARTLGISRRAFYRQLERHGLHTRVPQLREVSHRHLTPVVLERAS